MATIELSDAAPKVDGAISFTLGNADLDLTAGESMETEDMLLIGAAVAHPWLNVTFPAPVAQDAQPGYDANDPHDNPAADHLSPQAAPEVKEAADKADAEIQAAAFPNNVVAEDVAPADTKPDARTVTKTSPTVAAATPAASPASAPTDSPSTTGASS